LRFWGLTAFLLIRSIFFLATCKIPDRWIYHPVFGLWGPIFAFLTPKSIYFMLHVKFPIEDFITRPYWFWTPNYVSSGGLFLSFVPLKLYIFFIYIKFPMTFFIFELPSAQPKDPTDSKYFSKKLILNSICWTKNINTNTRMAANLILLTNYFWIWYTSNTGLLSKICCQSWKSKMAAVFKMATKIFIFFTQYFLK
jgi:hypothetical protein